MGYLTGKLTKRRVATAKAGRHGDGSGLYLMVDPSGARRWVLRVTVKRKRRDLGLGGTSYVTLQEAREKAQEYRCIARQGGDPLFDAKRDIPTFAEMAKQVHKERLPTWKNPKHAAQWINTLRDYAFPHIGQLAVSDELLSNLVFERSGSCGDLVVLSGFNSVFKFDACDDFG